MAKQGNQKLKIIYIMQILLQKTDEQHTITVQELIRELALHGISAERKSIYDDLENLRTFGLDICSTKTNTTNYFIANRDFELPELKLLVDSVQASQFITEKKTKALIKKLEQFCSMYEAQLLQREVYVANRVKHMNESIYLNVDKIHEGISENRKISFKYFEYALNKNRVYRRGGEPYCISPFALTWDNDNYYMIGYDAQAAMIKHYRVDRMEHIAVSKDAREGQEAFAKVDMAVYTKRAFGMYGGEVQHVDIAFSNHLVGVVMDRFGKDIPLLKMDDARFHILAPVIVSPQFYGWVFGLGKDAQILGPAEVREGMKAQLQSMAGLYAEKV